MNSQCYIQLESCHVPGIWDAGSIGSNTQLVSFISQMNIMSTGGGQFEELKTYMGKMRTFCKSWLSWRPGSFPSLSSLVPSQMKSSVDLIIQKGPSSLFQYAVQTHCTLPGLLWGGERESQSQPQLSAFVAVLLYPSQGTVFTYSDFQTHTVVEQNILALG